MKISAAGLNQIAELEAIVLGPYLDSQKIWTWGIGHTADAGGLNPALMPRTDTRIWSDWRVADEIAKILDLFDRDLDSYEARVNQAIKVPLKQHQFDALVSFDFNTGGILKARLTQQINAGDMSGEGFMGWLKPKEIIGRRRAEQALFLTGDYAANGDAVPVYDALTDGRIRFRCSMKLKR